MNDQERKTLEHLADAAIAFGQLDEYHSADAQDFAYHIHALQNIVMSRLAVRTHPELFHRSETQ